MAILINAYCTLREPPPLEFPHQLLGARDRTDPGLAPHLQGFIGYMVNLAGGQMTQTAYHIMRHIERVQRQFSFNAVERDLDAVSRWARAANAILYLPSGVICDPSGQQLLPETGNNSKAQVPYPGEAQERKARVMAQVSALGIDAPPTLPPVISEPEVDLRPGSVVAKRCLALFVAAVRAESLAAKQAIPIDELLSQFHLAVPAFTPKERTFIDTPSPSEQDVISFAWRYEALYLLEWVLGLAAELPFPTEICDVPLTARLAIDNNVQQFVDSARLRPAGEILDALDLHYRLHWAVRQARVDRREAPANLNPGVIQERHYALNWLVRFEDAEWDDVDTPT